MPQSYSLKSMLLATTLMTIGVIATSQADAQERIRERVDTDRVLETIEVTAQKRAQDLQDVPIAIQALNAETLETLRIDGFDDLSNFTPGLIASPNPADSSGLRLSIRGIGQDDPQIGLDATVGLYVNGVYVGKTPGLAFDTPDLERIEVLKGPQGTLYGRNAVAGAINIITKGAEIGAGFSGTATLEAGNFNTFGAKGAVNIPLGDSAAVKLSGLLFNRDGYVENVPTSIDLVALSGNPLAGVLQQGRGADFGGVERTGYALDFAWELTPELRLEYGLDGSTSLNEPYFSQLVPNQDGGFGFFQAPTVGTGFELVPVTQGFQREAVSAQPVEETRSDIIGHRLSADWDWDADHSLKFTAAHRRADVDAYTAFFPEMNPFVLGGALAAGTVDPTAPADIVTNPSSLDLLGTIAPGLFAAIGVDVRDNFALPFNTPAAPPVFNGPFTSFGTGAAQGIPTLDNHKQFSLELTQTGSFSDRFTYTAGLFYFDEDTAAGQFLDRPGDGLGFAQLLPSLALLEPIQGVLAGPPGDPANGLIGTGLQLEAIAGALTNPATPPAALPGLNAQLVALQAQLAALQAQLTGLGETAGAIYKAARSPGARLELDTQAFAAYGELSIAITDKLTVTGGLRYSRDQKKAFQQGYSPFFNDTIDLQGNPIEPLTGDETFDSIDPKLVLEYSPNEDLFLYASYSQAFRSGGFNQASVNLDDFVFDEERIRSGEIGFKSDWYNNRLRINANVFASFIEGQQFTYTNPLIPIARFIENNDADFIGFEVDGQYVVGDYLTASFSYAYLDAEADEFINPFTGTLAGGVDNAPKNSYSVNLDYLRPFGSGELHAHLGFNHKDATTIIGVPRTASNLLDARIAYTLGSIDTRQISIFAYGQNLTDDEYTIDGLDVLSDVIGTTRIYGQPRTFGGGVSVTF